MRLSSARAWPGATNARFTRSRYVDLKKAYDALDWERTLKILAAYGVGPKLLALQKHFWETATLVCRAGGNYGEMFGAKRGVTQGGPLLSLMFNVCVDAVVREWLYQTLGGKKKP